MNKTITATLAVVLGLGVSGALAQEASGTMSSTEMASGTMAKHPMDKKKMKHAPTKKNDAMGMKHEASGAMGN